MNREVAGFSEFEAMATGSTEGQAAVLLAVGEAGEWTKQRTLPFPDGYGVIYTSFEEVPRHVGKPGGPLLVISPILALGFDCIDLAQLLCRLNFPGAYRAVAEALPNPGMIRREIRDLCPKLDFDIITAREE